MKGLHEGENIWEHLPGMDSNPDVDDIKNFDTILKNSLKWCDLQQFVFELESEKVFFFLASGVISFIIFVLIMVWIYCSTVHGHK